MPRNSYQAIDPRVLLNAVGGDISSFCALSQTFLRTAPPALGRLDEAMQAGDSVNLMLESHSLKSTTSLVGAVQLTSLIEELERRWKSGDRAEAMALLPATRAAFDVVTREVSESIAAIQDPASDQRALS